MTNGKLTDVSTSNYAPKFIGGRSIGAKIYWDEVPPEVRAYDPENRIIMMTGPANGTLAPGATRVSIVSKSPVIIPETYCYSTPGNHWAVDIKFAGYDGVIVQGKAPEPVYLWIHDGEAEIRKVGYLWGKVTSKVDKELKRLHGLRTKTMIIGPAGENLVKDSVIEIEGHSATGTGGFGGVMGSKNLKAIAVRGTGSVKVARPKELMDVFEYFIRIHSPSFVGRGFGHWFDKGPYVLREEVEKGNATTKWGSCWACRINCLRSMRFKNLDVPNGTQKCNGFIELMQEDFERTGKWCTTDAWEFGILCDDLGLSVTQVLGHLTPWWDDAHHGGTWALELVWTGLWTEENTGLPVGTKEKPNVGSKEFNRAVLHKVAYRKGIGDLIAEGQQCYLKHIYETAPPELKQIAKDLYDKVVYIEKYHAIWHPRHVHDGISTFLHRVSCVRTFGISKPRYISVPKEAKKDLANRYFGDERAADPFVPEFKVPVVVLGQHMFIEGDSLTWCYFGSMPVWTSLNTPDYMGDLSIGAKIFSAVTGIDRTLDEMLHAHERAFNLERAIAVREGRRREHDIMNDYQFTKARWPQPDGPNSSPDWMNKKLFRKLMDKYYTARGWDLATGIPRRSKLEELDLKDVADELEKKYGVTVPP